MPVLLPSPVSARVAHAFGLEMKQCTNKANGLLSEHLGHNASSLNERLGRILKELTMNDRKTRRQGIKWYLKNVIRFRFGWKRIVSASFLRRLER
jgi:hypothetical protein